MSDPKLATLHYLHKHRVVPETEEVSVKVFSTTSLEGELCVAIEFLDSISEHSVTQVLLKPKTALTVAKFMEMLAVECRAAEGEGVPV